MEEEKLTEGNDRQHVCVCERFFPFENKTVVLFIIVLKMREGFLQHAHTWYALCLFFPLLAGCEHVNQNR